MKSNTPMIQKLQTAVNVEGDRILYRTRQFYSKTHDRVITMYYIERSVYDEEKGKDVAVELFHSSSQLQIVLFLRDLLFINRGQPIPVDNEIWNEKRSNISFYQNSEIKYDKTPNSKVDPM